LDDVFKVVLILNNMIKNSFCRVLKKSFVGVLVAVFFLGICNIAFAADEGEGVTPAPQIEIQIDSVDEVAVSRKLILDATGSVPQSELNNFVFEWDFGDGKHEFGAEVAHNYATPGDYVVSLSIDGKGQSAEIEKNIFVYNNNILLVSDQSVDFEMIEGFMNAAREQNTVVSNFHSVGGVSEFLVEEELLQDLIDGQRQIKDADIIMFWTEGSLGATLLSELRNALPSNLIDFSNKDIMFITEGNLSGLENIAQGTFDSVEPNRIIITHSEARFPLLKSLDVDAEDAAEFIEILKSRGIGFGIISSPTKFKVHRFMSYFINYMINHGVPSNTVRLVLVLSVIVTVVSFMKQVIGLDTLGVYTPSMLAISFIALDVWFGLFILLAILLISLITRRFIKRYRMMYIPRMSFVMIVVSLLILVLLMLGTFFNVTQIIAISIFPMFLLISVVERCISLVGDKGLKTASGIMVEVIIVSLIAYLVADSAYVRTMVLAYPEIVFALLVVNVFLGRWKGLRIVEYVRFREVFSHYAEEE
jgi:PKD repeat protein